MAIIIKFIGILMAINQFFLSLIIPVDNFEKNKDLFTSLEKASFSEIYYEVSPKKKNDTETWRQGMISGNGMQGVITSGSPYSDTLIYQNMHFILPNNIIRYCPDTSDMLEMNKQNITNSQNVVDYSPYDDVYSFHPGAALRIKQTSHLKTGFIRYTDYETATVGVRYSDLRGTWERTTFTSKTDDVTITKIGSSSAGNKVDIILSMDDISTYANYGNGHEVDLKYKKIVSDNCEYIAFVAHYPDYENSELKNGGYSTLVYVINEGGFKTETSNGIVKDEQYCGSNDPAISITGAENVYLIAVSDRTYDMGAYSDFENAKEYALVDELESRVKAVAEKYSENGRFAYDKAREEHAKVFSDEYDRVKFTLGDKISTKSNEGLVLDQYLKNELNADLIERAYYSGRYAYLCSSGSSTPRLYGMWTGEWAPGWGSKYTMDANVNLQTSSMNTGNMPSSYIGYALFILRQAPDWEENARATHGFTDALQAPVNTDGDKAVLTETCYPYPFRYWNAGTSWMLQPLYETLMCYGDVEIPITDEIDLNVLKSILSVTAEDLTGEEISALENKGTLDLRSEILLPLLIKSANYWAQMLSPEYYTDAEGYVRYQEGKSSLLEGEKYAILPSYSPENNPSNYGCPSTANCAIDISACRNNFEMLIDVMKSVDENADTSRWEQLMSDLPDYLFDETGALKEWAARQFEENNLHRHLSHLYCVWPLFETQKDARLKAACEQAIVNRNSENEASHALIHRALIAARLKNRKDVTSSLVKLVSRWIYYDSLMTNHDYDRGSCYCTDFAIGYLGIINESLVYSYENDIELLPALPLSAFEKGEISGIRTRNRVVVDSLKWDMNSKTAVAVITSEIAQTIVVSSPLSEQTKTLTFAAGETKTVELALI